MEVTMGAKTPILIRKSCTAERTGDPTPTSFSPSDLNACFGFECHRPPEFRLIEVEGAGRFATGETFEGGTSVALFRRACAVSEIRNNLEILDGKAQSDIPVLGFTLLPLHLNSERSAELRAEITPEVWTESASNAPQ
jgi:hypothetical protein